MRKKIAIILTITVLMGLMSMMVPANAANTIEAINATVVAPVAGQTPSYECQGIPLNSYLDTQDPDYGECQQNGLVWFNGGLPMSPADVFEIGGIYTVRIMLCANNGYQFGASPSVVINNTVGVVQYINSVWASVELTFSELQGYTVSFNAGANAFGTMPSKQVPGGNYTLPECTFVAPNGKVFKEWKLDHENTRWKPGETIPVYSDISLTAIWKDQSTKQQVYNIVATSDDLESIPVLYGKKNTLPTFTITQGAPAHITVDSSNLRWQKKNGDVWEYDYSTRFSAGEWRVATQIRIDGDDAAQYELGDPVTFTVNGKAWDMDENGHPYVDNNYSCIFVYSPAFVIEDDPSVQPPVQINAVNMQLKGYVAGRSVDDAVVVSDAGVNIDHTFLEILDMEGLNNNDPNAVCMATGTFSADGIYALVISAESKNNYTLEALTPNNISLNEAGETLFANVNINDEQLRCAYILKAPSKYTVKFNSNGGSAVASQSVAYGSKAVKPTNPTKSGYVFKGWTLSGTLYDFDTPVSSNVTLYASWEIKEPAHTSHTGGTATCKAKAKCTVCGKTYGSLAAHKYIKKAKNATLTANGKIYYQCSVCGVIATQSKVIYKPASFKLSTTAYTYNGSVRTPSVTVKDSKGTVLKKGTDYTVKYESGRKAPGKYTVAVTFKGCYSGTKKLYFTIAPKATTKITATHTTTAIALKWNKVTGATGYCVYEYNAKTKKYETLKVTAATSLKISGLKAGTDHYYKVRAYTKDGNVIWGAYSATFGTATKPSTPKITKLTTTKGKAGLVWSNVSGESGYQVYYSTKKNGGYKKLGTYKANVYKCAKSKLSSNKTYYFIVRAYKKTASGIVYSSWSAAKGIKIK